MYEYEGVRNVSFSEGFAKCKVAREISELIFLSLSILYGTQKVYVSIF